MDDAKIRELTEEVLGQLAGARDPVSGDLETRVEALERALAALRTAPPGAAVAAAVVRPLVTLALHPSQQLLSVSGAPAEGRCVLEPDRPCVESGQCRTLGH